MSQNYVSGSRAAGLRSSMRAVEFFDLAVLPVLADYGQEHGVRTLVVVGTVLQLKPVYVDGLRGPQGVGEAPAAEVAAAGVQADDRKATGQIPLQRNEPRFGLGVDAGESTPIAGDNRGAGVVRKRDHLGNVNAGPVLAQFLSQRIAAAEGRRS